MHIVIFEKQQTKNHEENDGSRECRRAIVSLAEI